MVSLKDKVPVTIKSTSLSGLTVLHPLNYHTIQGNILDSVSKIPNSFICHQCNCQTKTGIAAGLAKDVFDRFPESNCYKSNVTRIPGTISIVPIAQKGCGVVNLFAQDGYGSEANRKEKKQRLVWFKECLNRLGELPEVQTVSFPYKIGCGLAGGEWDQYDGLIREFAARNPSKVVYIWKCGPALKQTL